MPQVAPLNGGAPGEVFGRVAETQAKLHRWAAADLGRGFDDPLNLEHNSATLMVAFARVAGNRGGGVLGLRCNRDGCSPDGHQP